MSAKQVINRVSPAAYVAAFCLVLLLCGRFGGVPALAAPPPPTLVLFPRSRNSADDFGSLIAVRGQLRKHGQFEVLTFDPEAATFKRAAADAKHPEWLTTPPGSDADRLAIARGAGAAFFAVIAPGAGRDKADVHLVETAPAARVWEFTDKKPDDAAKAIARQAADALAHPAPAPVTPAVPAPSVPAAPAPTVTPAPVPAPVIAPTPVTAPAAVPAVTPPAVAPAPSTMPVAPAPVPAVSVPPVKKQAQAENLTAIQPKLDLGDTDLASGNVVDAISEYRQAINDAPLSAVPRLKLAQAYLQGGLRDKALDEAKRALEIAPDNQSIQKFLMDMDAESGSSEGAITRYKALAAQRPQDPAVQLGLGDALWSSGDYAGAEDAYKAARRLAKAGDHTANARLARLYAAQTRYDDSLQALKSAGAAGYVPAIHIVQNSMDALSSGLETAKDAFDAGKITREWYYDTARKASAQSQALADFVSRITPPPAYKLSHLHRMLAANLLAQQAAVVVRYLETSDPAQAEKAAQLDKAAQTELLTAHAAEEKLGLWEAKK